MMPQCVSFCEVCDRGEVVRFRHPDLDVLRERVE